MLEARKGQKSPKSSRATKALTTMRLAIASLFLAGASAFAPTFLTQHRTVAPLHSMAEDVGIPCEDECALESYPNLPASVHPGVLSGQAMMDLLQHAKENGKHDFWKLRKNFDLKISL